MAIALTCVGLTIVLALLTVISAMLLSGAISRDEERLELMRRLQEIHDDSSTTSS